MAGDVGAVASLLDTVAKFFLSEAGYGEFTIRRTVERLRRDMLKAIQDGDYQRGAELLDELERVSTQA